MAEVFNFVNDHLSRINLNIYENMYQHSTTICHTFRMPSHNLDPLLGVKYRTHKGNAIATNLGDIPYIRAYRDIPFTKLWFSEMLHK